MSRELQQVSCPPCRLGSYRDAPTTPRAGLSPARNTAPFHGAPNKSGLGTEHQEQRERRPKIVHGVRRDRGQEAARLLVGDRPQHAAPADRDETQHAVAASGPPPPAGPPATPPARGAGAATPPPPPPATPPPAPPAASRARHTPT